MRSSIIFAAPFVAAAYAQSSDAVNTTVSIRNFTHKHIARSHH